MRIVAAGIACLFLSGCATVTRGTTNQITFVSEPPGAEMQSSAGHRCTTPCTIEMPRKQEFVATFSMPGYKSEQVPVQTRVAGSGAAGFAGNVLVGGLVGMGVDAATGSTLEHFPNPVSVTLQALRSSPEKRRRKEAAPTS